MDGHFFDEGGQLGPHTNAVLDLAQQLSGEYENHFVVKGPGIGDRETHSFISELREQSNILLGDDYAEKEIFSRLPQLENKVAIRVDYWFPDEETILEIAFGLRNPLSEFERDVLKAVTARAAGLPVSKLVLLSKPGALKRMGAPWCQNVIRWAKEQGVSVHIFELKKLPKRDSSIS